MAAWKLSALLLLLATKAPPQPPASGLQVQFSVKGLERLTYNGQVLEDVERWPADAFHIGHMKCYDASGRAATQGQYGWGENHDDRSWDAATKTWTYRFVWGEVQVRYLVRAGALDMQVTEINKPGSSVVLDGAEIYPLALHLRSGSATTIVDNGEAPGVTSRDWGEGKIAVVAADAQKVLYSGLQAGQDGASEVLVSGTRPDALQGRPGAPGRAVKPGETDRFTLSVRFAARGVPVEQVAGDAYAAWRTRWPETLHWTDRRIIGTVFLASSPAGNKPPPAGYENNPRRYFTDAAVDVRGGLVAFQNRVLRQAGQVVANLKRLDAQGAITWDIEGEQYPQDTSYVCAPDQIARAAPEMESLVISGPHAGMKLVDAYFRIIHDAGLRVGVCVRPQRFTIAADGSAHQAFLPESEVAAELIRKMRFAYDRWGATLFYLDSTVRADGSTLPAEIIEQAAAAMPDSLLIPEESSLRMSRATAPFQTFLFHGDVSTAAAVRALYPHAFGANLVNDVDPGKLSAHRQQLVDAVRGGDILMVLAGYWQQNDATVSEIYRQAKTAP